MLKVLEQLSLLTEPWYPIKETNMNFLERKMFANGGPSTPSGPLGPNQIYDTVSGKIYNLDEGFVDNLFLKGRNLYPILKDNTLIKGPNVAAALEKFRDQDEPFDLSKRSFGYLQPRDVGTGLIDAGIATGRFFEPYVKKGIAGIGEFVGSDYLKTADDDVGVGLLGFKRDEMNSIFPTDEERSRAALERITGKNEPLSFSGGFDSIMGGANKASEFFGFDPIFQPKINNLEEEVNQLVGPPRADVDVVDEATITQIPTSTIEDINISPEFTPRFESETLSLEGGPFDMETRRLAYQEKMIGRDEFGNLLPEGRLEQDDEISKMLEDIKPAEQKVDVDKTEADTLADNEAKFGGLSQDEFRATIDDAATPKLLEIERPITDTTIVEEETLRKQNDPVSRKLDQPGFFGSDRFLNFIRNVGGELVRTGQFGEGLASGAAKASEERAARELMADAEERDYLTKLRLVRAEADYEAQKKLDEGPSDSMRKELRTVAQEMNADYNDIVSAKSTLEVVGRVEDILYNTDTTSFKAFAGELLEKVGSFFDADGKPSESGKSFDNLEPRTRAKVLLNQIKQKNIKSLLGENSKTISNLDRQIVEELVGSIALGKTPQETLEALKLTKESIYNSLSAAQTRLKSNFRFADAEGGLYLIQDNTKILDYLKTGILSNTYDNSYENQSIRKITLKE
jgi:hypothetical protein